MSIPTFKHMAPDDMDKLGAEHAKSRKAVIYDALAKELRGMPGGWVCANPCLSGEITMKTMAKLRPAMASRDMVVMLALHEGEAWVSWDRSRKVGKRKPAEAAVA
jgi:hypothetical protein